METTERLEYSEKMTALDGDSDFRRQLKPSALLRYVEQISADHARAHGMDYQFFQERHNAFLVAKTAVQITRRPVRSEEFTLTTACEVFRKGSMKRLTTLTDAEGNRLALVDCRWMLVDTQTGRILRGPSWTAENFQNESLSEELPQLVHKGKDLLPAGEWTARYSLCDLNGHINNAVYLDVACDVIPMEVWQTRELKFFSIKYHREVPMGEKMELFYASVEQGWYVLGRREEHAAFECYLEFGAPAEENGQVTKIKN